MAAAEEARPHPSWQLSLAVDAQLMRFQRGTGLSWDFHLMLVSQACQNARVTGRAGMHQSSKLLKP